MLDFIVFLVIAIPIAWLISEFQPYRWIRVLLGCAAIALSFQVAWVAGSFERFNSNIWYGAASKDLVDNTIEAIEKGDADKVVEELRVLSNALVPTYENRQNYDKLVHDYVHAISDTPIHHAESRSDPE